MKSRNFRTLLLTTVLLLQNCGLFETDEEPTKKVTLKGTVAVPDGPTEYIVLSDAYHVGYQWSSCPDTNNNSTLGGGTFSLESTNNCAGAQFVYFHPNAPVNLQDHSTGKITFKVQANNPNQQYTFVIQDANAVSSLMVNLTAFGFDPSKVAVDQAISIPITAITVPNFDFSKVDRVFQLTVTCSTSFCQTTVRDIKWVPSSTLTPPPLSSFQEMSYSPMAVKRIPHCDPFPCRRLPRASVGIMRTSTMGWKAEPAVPSVTTDSEGHFTLLVDANLLKGDGPIFIAVSDSSGSYTLLSTIPDDLIKESATIDLAVDRTTTAVGVMTCPDGMTIPSDGSGGWCIGDPISSTELDTTNTAVDGSFDTTLSLEIEIILSDVNDDPAAVDALDQFLSDNGLPDVSSQQIMSVVQNISLPIVPKPNDSTSGSTGTKPPTNTGITGGTNKQCQAVITCEVCSINACADTNADGTSCYGWYDGSDGSRFACSGNCQNMDCNAAANAAMSHCCPPPK